MNSRTFVYVCFVGFIIVNLLEGLVIDFVKKDTPKAWNSPAPTYLEFNASSFYVIDALWRLIVSLCLLCTCAEGFTNPFQNLSKSQCAKIFSVRFGIQVSEQLATIGTIYLSAASNAVIKQMQIPLVALFAFVLYRAKLSRNQLLFVLAIVPIAIQFNLIGDNSPGSNNYVGYLLAIGGTIFASSCNVFAEYILKDELKERTVWNKQFTFAVFDAPIMVMIWFGLTAFEIYGTNIEARTWNPFAANELRNMGWIILLGINGGSWGFVRLGILNDADALWFNLSQAFVLTVLWGAEVTQDPKRHFNGVKLLALMSLIVTLTGYELVSRDRELEKMKKEEEKPVGPKIEMPF